MQIFSAWVAGVLFGVGLILGGMTNPGKVLGFLDLAGTWDPSLALVMGGAMGVATLAFAVARGRQTALLGGPMQIPQARTIDSRLVLGSLAFGVGWGLAGFCPGPALVAIASGVREAGVFGAAMVVGMAVFEYFLRPKAK